MQCPCRRKAKDEAVLQRDQSSIQAERRVRVCQAEASEARAALEASERRRQQLTAEVHEAGRAQEALHTQLMSLQSKHATVVAQAEVCALAVCVSFVYPGDDEHTGSYQMPGTALGVP